MESLVEENARLRHENAELKSGSERGSHAPSTLQIARIADYLGLAVSTASIAATGRQSQCGDLNKKVKRADSIY
jgi:hypothetical protein